MRYTLCRYLFTGVPDSLSHVCVCVHMHARARVHACVFHKIFLCSFVEYNDLFSHLPPPSLSFHLIIFSSFPFPPLTSLNCLLSGLYRWSSAFLRITVYPPLSPSPSPVCPLSLPPTAQHPMTRAKAATSFLLPWQIYLPPWRKC